MIEWRTEGAPPVELTLAVPSPLSRLAAGCPVGTEATTPTAGVIDDSVRSRFALEPLEVTAQSRRELGVRTSNTRRDLVAGKELLDAQRRGTKAVDLIRRFPGLKVREIRSRDGLVLGTCVESNRALARLQQRPACEMVPVILDGVPVGGPSQFLRNLKVGDFESIQFVSALDGAIRYGLDAASAGGALVLWTRGRGPHVQTGRNP